MTVTNDPGIYRVTPEYIEVTGGTDTIGAQSVQQALRIVISTSNEPLMIDSDRSPEPDLPLEFFRQTFRDINARAIIVSAKHADDLPTVCHEVSRALPHGWTAVPSKYRQRECQEAARRAGVGVFSVVDGTLQCLVS